MSIGTLLLERRFLTREQFDEAQRRHRMAGGLLSDTIIGLGYVTRDQLEALYAEPPPAPDSPAQTGLDAQFLQNFVLKALYVTALETIPDTAEYVKLPPVVVEEIFETAKKQRLIEVIGLKGQKSQHLRYALTDLGRKRALEAMDQCQYTGPAPATLHDYQAQVEKGSVSHERPSTDALARSFGHLVLAEEVLDQLGPAVSSGKSILIYGGVGNGKTSVAEAIGQALQQKIYVPYCIEVAGQIVKLFDPAVHRRVEEPGAGGASPANVDPRWVLCHRPVVITGGELTMEMLDLTFDAVSKYYEAPAHIKANGGVFIIDDFGRQRVRTIDLLNRWILPLERRVDYLTLHTGGKLQIPFDQLVIFSTNYPPQDLMDAAALRRIPYKILVDPPTQEDFAAIFRRVCDAHELKLPDELLRQVVREMYAPDSENVPPAGYQPKFIVEHVLARCSFEGHAPQLTHERVEEALRNLGVREAVNTA